MPSITVFLSSSTTVDPVFFDLARQTGRAIAQEKWTLVYGGNAVGPMKALADGAREAGGRVVGITPHVFVEMGLADKECDELIMVDSMRERKKLLEARADAFLTLPGGLGTLEEFIEILVAKQLKYHAKPMVVIDHKDVWKPLMEYFDHGIRMGFVRAQTPNDFTCVNDVPAAMRILKESLGK